MKVLCITDCSDRPETELFIRLAKMVEHLTVMSNPDGRNYSLLVRSGVRLLPLKIRGRWDRNGSAAIRAEVAEGDYDIVHAFNSQAVACMLRAARHHRARLLAYRGVTTGISYWKPECWHTFLHPRLDGIFCVADAVREAFLDTRFLFWRFPGNKAITIHKGHSPQWYAGEPVSPTTFGIPHASRTICCISRNSEKKGGVTLIDAFDRLPSELKCHLLLVGTIGANREVRFRSAGCRHPERIHFTGYRDDAVAIIQGANLLVSASESGEGLPRTVLEAMCVGTPVVATDAGGTRELVLEGETGLLVAQRKPEELAAAIDRSFRYPEETANRVLLARRRIEQLFSPEITADRTFAWYREILGRS